VTCQEAANRLTQKLRLDTPPIALSFVDSPPAGIDTFDEEVPSSCAFWRKAESKVFYAPAAKHLNCLIGAMVMGFDLPEAVQPQLGDLVSKMCSLGYIGDNEPSKIPTVKKKSVGIVYGPLAEFPVEPDLILAWLTPSQAMIYNESAGTVQWTASLPQGVFGRPACGALPVALANSQPTLSMGCMGMRTFTQIAGDRLLSVMPATKLEEFVGALESTVSTNEAMRAFYEEQRDRLAQEPVLATAKEDNDAPHT
jgi:uncharacterized protein (DUF169 family)